MGYWEFLLQKEGDQSWLPLDTSQVEILEGRYRVMAHSSQVSTPVQIQISQVLGDRLPPKRRILRRQGEINENGLMVVMPFTRLGEGTWDILCACDRPDPEIPKPEIPDAEISTGGETAPEAWRYAVQLRVVGQNSADEGDWFADDGSTGIGAAAVDRVANPEATGLPHPPDEPPSLEIDLPAVAEAMDRFQAQLATGLSAATALYGLTLPSSALLGSEGESLGLTATLTGGEEASPDLPLTLVVRLSDPQTVEPVALTLVPVGVATLPASVILTVTIPHRLATRLLLGEVGLLAGPDVVALQRFTVTVDVASLFDAIANQAETETELDVVFPVDAVEEGSAGPPRSAPDAKFWEIASRGVPPRQLPTLPRTSLGLPPKIYYPSPHETAVHQPSLPLVGRTRSSTPTETPKNDAAPASSEAEPSRGLSLPPITSSSPADDSIAVLTGRSPTPTPSQSPSPTPQLLSQEAMGFKDLNLQDRFWNRLNELAISLQQAALDNRTEAETSAPSAPETPVLDPSTEAPPLIPFAGEVVIYEDEDPTLRDLTATADPAEAEFASEAEPPVETMTPPMPSLELPEGDLIAGDTVVMTLRVPFHPNRLYLKAWITDPQTRTLADEPRQLLNLLPNGQGQLEGNLQLTVPLGCLEAWFEAISIDMITQQESYKVSVSRSIAPAGLRSPSLEDDFPL
ncbi:hypothetical protein IQ254_05470 [Nodosilinea sp. LEGE 07088]|uniref:hypothetical protein n=1 Tax=Nodosilinea sp. LEGE 07088 TaxID=2777968 RepID=UPI0018824FC5|nr:hypothetical protein [Nodosilinea sp. LEGE 07088]MBE9136655.1 hypothetical protein [Nodosilinea sp. LEGE 07088]